MRPSIDAPTAAAGQRIGGDKQRNRRRRAVAAHNTPNDRTYRQSAGDAARETAWQRAKSRTEKMLADRCSCVNLLATVRENGYK